MRARMVSWVQTAATIHGADGPWTGSGPRRYEGARLEIIHDRHVGQVHARLFDAQGFQLEEAVVTEHTADRGHATIHTASGETWTVDKLQDCGCG